MKNKFISVSILVLVLTYAENCVGGPLDVLFSYDDASKPWNNCGLLDTFEREALSLIRDMGNAAKASPDHTPPKLAPFLAAFRDLKSADQSRVIAIVSKLLADNGNSKADALLLKRLAIIHTNLNPLPPLMPQQVSLPQVSGQANNAGCPNCDPSTLTPKPAKPEASKGVWGKFKNSVGQFWSRWQNTASQKRSSGGVTGNAGSGKSKPKTWRSLVKAKRS